LSLLCFNTQNKKSVEASKAAKKDERQIVRAAGGESWKDDTLKEWDDSTHCLAVLWLFFRSQ